jgi:cation diffusion facilitator CzcD-associated flavoprotein CzcO
VDPQTNYHPQTDYLVIGAGASGLAFADELFTRRGPSSRCSTASA